MNIFHRLAILLLSSLTLIACSGSGSSGTSTGGTGTVGILITDKPADPSMFLSVNASIESVVLLPEEDDDDDDSDNDGGDDSSDSDDSDDNNVAFTLYDGPTKVVDLLRLRHESVPLTFKDNIPAGEYCKIRLILSDLELVLTDSTPDDVTDNPTYHPSLPGNGKLDMVARGCFEVEDGGVLTLQIDIDVANSIHIVNNGDDFQFRPVVFVDAIDADFVPKLVRLSGTIAEIDDDDELILCDAIPANGTDLPGCVAIEMDDKTAFFDNETHAGAPRPLSELLDDTQVGKTITVVGWPEHMTQPGLVVDIPDGHLPSDGLCRLWQVDLAPGQQDEPVDCDTIPDDIPEGFVLVEHDGLDDDDHNKVMELEALVIELGDFAQVDGEVETAADAAGFAMTAIAGTPVTSTGPLSVMFQDGGIGFNGTRIVSRDGELLTPDMVVVPLAVQVDGVIESLSGSDDILKAALVIVDTKDVPGMGQLIGNITHLGAGSINVDPDEDEACGLVTDDLLVELKDELEIMSVTITDSGSEIVPGGTLAVGQSVGMIGECEDGGYETDNIVIVDDQRAQL